MNTVSVERHNEECRCIPILVTPIEAFVISTVCDFLKEGDTQEMLSFIASESFGRKVTIEEVEDAGKHLAFTILQAAAKAIFDGDDFDAADASRN